MIDTELGTQEAVPFRPLRRRDVALPLEDHGLVGDGTTAALIGRDGSVDWLCLPRFDSRPPVGDVLEPNSGALSVTMVDAVESRQWYERDTAVLVTELRGPSGAVRITDALAVFDCDLAEPSRADRGELVREVRAVSGFPAVRVRVSAPDDAVLRPRGGVVELVHHGASATSAGLEVVLSSTRALTGAETLAWLRPSERLYVSLRWRGNADPSLEGVARRLDDTRRAWRTWSSRIEYGGPQRSLVRRAALTLKLLTSFEHGALLAAPTSSLVDGQGKRKDDRCAWLRDLALAIEPFEALGLHEEAASALRWLFDAVGEGGAPTAVYDLDGAAIGAERVPVAAAVQDDAVRHFLACARVWAGDDDDEEPVANPRFVSGEAARDPSLEASLFSGFERVERLVAGGRTDDARTLFDRLCRLSSTLGLLPDAIDARSGTFVGNFPRALSHVGLLRAAVALSRR